MTTYYIDKYDNEWTVAEFREHLEHHKRGLRPYKKCPYRPFRRVTKKDG
jgi:hypothetical protein